MSSSSAPARPAVCWPNASAPMDPSGCCCLKPAAATGGFGSRRRLATAKLFMTLGSTGGTPLSQTMAWAGVAVTGPVARCWAARARSMPWSTAAVCPATLRIGAPPVTRAGAGRISSRCFGAWSAGCAPMARCRAMGHCGCQNGRLNTIRSSGIFWPQRKSSDCRPAPTSMASSLKGWAPMRSIPETACAIRLPMPFCAPP